MTPAAPPAPALAPDSLPAVARHAYAHGLPLEAREPHLAGVIGDALENPGGLTRLQLGLAAGRILGLPAAAARSFATGLEYFHTASLLLDDLPCMDDARMRRGRPCAHVAHGEGSAILGALAFINRAYRLFWDALASAAPAGRAAATAHIERCLGASGVLEGQSRDLHFAASDRSAREVARVALGKTVALLRLSLVTPVLLADAAPPERLLVDRLSVAWGLAYQIADDFNDLSSHRPTGKTGGRDTGRGRPNFVVAAGRDLAAARLHRHLRHLGAAHDGLVALRPAWRALGPLIDRFRVAATTAALDHPATRCA